MLISANVLKLATKNVKKKNNKKKIYLYEFYFKRFNELKLKIYDHPKSILHSLSIRRRCFYDRCKFGKKERLVIRSGKLHSGEINKTMELKVVK